MRQASGFLVGSIGSLLFAGSAMAGLHLQREAHLEAVVMAESSGEPYEGKLAVAEVLRNRDWDPEGFTGMRRKDLSLFLSRQPASARLEAKKALQAARAGSNLTGHATHFENIEAFGFPRWEREMERTAKIGRHTFFRQRKGGVSWTNRRRVSWIPSRTASSAPFGELARRSATPSPERLRG
ncbi:MAG: cell wall hydrolase [Candidatus Omnitrophica bacterium]|nr:cell wall hydrolase [Candidatus Omnitrophota bacterium]